jgi:hypothetical protein
LDGQLAQIRSGITPLSAKYYSLVAEGQPRIQEIDEIGD